jgi:hypothetical protein
VGGSCGGGALGGVGVKEWRGTSLSPQASSRGETAEKWFQECYGVEEVHVLDEHRQVDRIEVPITLEAVSEICLGCLLDHELAARRVRTEEEKVPFPILLWPIEMLEEGTHGDVVPDPVKIVALEVLAHRLPPYGIWNSCNVC